MARDFPVTTEAAEGGTRQVVIVSCATCDVQAVLSAHWQGPDRGDQISRHLRKRGWLVGKRPTGDRCPDCARTMRRVARKVWGRGLSNQETMNAACEWAIENHEVNDQARAAELTRRMREMKKPTHEQTAAFSSETSPAALSPAAPDRESRRLIHAEIDAVWLDDRKGYAGGVSDRSIAEKMGIPVAWVAEVREFSFGPVMVNEDLEKFRSELSANMEHLAAIEEQQKFLAREVEVTKSALAALTRRAEPLLKAVRP